MAAFAESRKGSHEGFLCQDLGVRSTDAGRKMKGVTTYSESTCFHEAGHAIVAAALGLEVQSIRIHKDDGGGDTVVPTGPLSQLPLIDQVAVCYAGVEAWDIWQLVPEHLGEWTDVDKFFRLVKDLSDEERDAVHKAGCERANQLLNNNKVLVETVAHRLGLQGYLTATEFKQLTEGLTSRPT
jgi:ATP-dependent Zn protease